MTRAGKRLLTAVSVGLLISGSFYLYANQPPAAAEAVPAGTMLVITSNVPANTPLEAKHFMVESRPLAYIAPGAIHSPEEILGRHTKWDLVPGDPITEEKLLKLGEEAGSLLPIPPGKRAVTVKVDEFVGVAGFVQPNSIVDVIAIWDVSGAPHSKVILQKIRVLAVAQEANRAEDAKARITSSVTLAVTPAESEKLILGAERGSIRLAMRSPEELAEISTSGTTPAALTGAPAKPAQLSSAPRPAPKQAPQAEPVVILRGTRPDSVSP